MGCSGEEQHSGDGSFIRAGSPLRALCLRKETHLQTYCVNNSVEEKELHVMNNGKQTTEGWCVVICGVMVVSFQNMETFPVHKNPFLASSSSPGFPVPFDLPPTCYSAKGTQVQACVCMCEKSSTCLDYSVRLSLDSTSTAV